VAVLSATHRRSQQMEQPIAIDVDNEEIKGVLRSVIERVHGINAVLVSTADGVPLVEVVAGPEAASPEALAYFQVCIAGMRAFFFRVCSRAA
jgi:hypothetical protein